MLNTHFWINQMYIACLPRFVLCREGLVLKTEKVSHFFQTSFQERIVNVSYPRTPVWYERNFHFEKTENGLGEKDGPGCLTGKKYQNAECLLFIPPICFEAPALLHTWMSWLFLEGLLIDTCLWDQAHPERADLITLPGKFMSWAGTKKHPEWAFVGREGLIVHVVCVIECQGAVHPQHRCKNGD